MAYCNQTIRLLRPRTTPKPGDELQREHDLIEEMQVRAWIKQMSSIQALHSLGIAATQAYSIRFGAPAEMRHAPATGWQIRDGEDQLYIVRAVLQTGTLITITAEKV